MTSEVLAWAAVLIPLLLLNASPAVNGDAGSDYLDQKELEVSWIAGNASQANGNCGTTSSSSTLSGPRMPLAYMRLIIHVVDTFWAYPQFECSCQWDS